MITEYEDSANKPYHYARIEFFEDAEDDSVGTIAAEVRELFRRIAHAAFKLSGNRGALPDIPAAEPEQLSFLVAAALELKSSEKLEMISLTSTARRLTKLKVHLEKNVRKMEESAEIVIAAEKNGHAKKPLPPIG
jgi:Lon protease-like protein